MQNHRWSYCCREKVVIAVRYILQEDDGSRRDSDHGV